MKPIILSCYWTYKLPIITEVIQLLLNFLTRNRHGSCLINFAVFFDMPLYWLWMTVLLLQSRNVPTYLFISTFFYQLWRTYLSKTSFSNVSQYLKVIKVDWNKWRKLFLLNTEKIFVFPSRKFLFKNDKWTFPISRLFYFNKLFSVTPLLLLLFSFLSSILVVVLISCSQQKFCSVKVLLRIPHPWYLFG